MGKSYTDDELIEAIKAGGKLREQAIRFMNDHYKSDAIIIAGKLGISGNEYREPYNRSLIALTLNIEQDKYERNASIKTYWSKIFRNKVLDFRKNENGKLPISDLEDLSDSIESDEENYISSLISKEEMESLRSKLNLCWDKLSEKCKKLLEGFYYEGKSYDELAEKLGYKNVESVAAAKSRCLRGLKECMTK